MMNIDNSRVDKLIMKKLVLIFVFLILFSKIGLADYYTCLNDTISKWNSTITVNGNVINIDNSPSYETCQFGCNSATGRCNPSPYDVSIGSLGILFSILGLGLIFYIMSSRTEDEIYKIFFHFAALLFFLATLLIDVSFIDNLNIASTMGYVADLLWIILAALTMAIFALFMLLINDAIFALSGKPLFGKRKKT